MSEKEFAYLQGITAEEHEDDIFCRKLLESYLNAPDNEKEEEYTLEECMKDWGIDYITT